MRPFAIRLTAAAAVLAGPGACSSAPPATDQELATAAVTETLDEFAGGDYGDAWDGLDSTAHSLISRPEWVRLHTALCRPVWEGRRFEIQDVRVNGAAGQARVARGGMVWTWPLAKEAGVWRLKFDPEQEAGYRAYTLEELAVAWRDAGGCQPVDAAAPPAAPRRKGAVVVSPPAFRAARPATPRPAVKAPAVKSLTAPRPGVRAPAPAPAPARPRVGR